MQAMRGCVMGYEVKKKTIGDSICIHFATGCGVLGFALLIKYLKKKTGPVEEQHMW